LPYASNVRLRSGDRTCVEATTRSVNSDGSGTYTGFTEELSIASGGSVRTSTLSYDPLADTFTATSPDARSFT
jgi:hypothetical protein